MKEISTKRRGQLALGAGALLLVATQGAASAQTTVTAACSDATMFPNPIYVAGSSAFEPTAQAIGNVVAQGTTPRTIIYQASASCLGPSGIRDNVTLAGTANAYAWNGSAVVKTTCNTDTAPTKADVGVADVSYKSCYGAAIPAGLADFPGPVQAMHIIVPEGNTTMTAISAEQAQNIWGCGTSGMISPFVDENAIQQRNKDSGTQIMVSKYIGVPADAFKGTANSGGGNLVTSLLAVTDPQKAIGFYAADGYDTKRTTLNALAFRGFGQTKAYYADSTPTAFDKKNVRDGHYQIFGPVHLFAAVGSDGLPTGSAKVFIDWIQGKAPIVATEPFKYVDIEGGAGMIPQCAMKVTRDDDGGLMKPYTPAVSCSCRFEKAIAKADVPGCVACADDAGCAGGKTCQSGFCE